MTTPQQGGQTRMFDRLRSGSRLALGALVALAILAWPAPARAGTYNFIQCHDWNAYGGDVSYLHPDGGYRADNQCGVAYSLKSVGNAAGGAAARMWFNAPGGTYFSAFSAAVDGRTADGHWSEVGWHDGGGYHVAYRASNQPGGFVAMGPVYPLHADQVFAHLACVNSGGCGASATAHTYVRNVAIEIRDPHRPSIGGIGGGLATDGWLRGVQGLTAFADDYGSGVAAFEARANGASIADAGVNCRGETPPYTAHLTPCSGQPRYNLSLDTAHGPFHNGTNVIDLRAADFARNVTSRKLSVKIDNARPAIAFANGQDPDDPELIRALVADRHSGVAAAKMYFRRVGAQDWQPLDTEIKDGLAQARVNSLAAPAGEYEFLASAGDVAGNGALTTKRGDGQSMKLSFPLRGAVELRAHLNRGGSKGQVVRYGTDAKAKGRMLDAYGTPLVGQQVTIVEHFGAGALLRERVSHATTDEKGKWRSKVPAGPSRDVEAIYAGTPRYAPASRGSGTFVVRSRASLKTSREKVREGHAVRFKGRVRHFGARIPSGGKLVELQVRVKPGRWDTIGEAFRTKENGRYKRRYRFGRHYARDTKFRFRVKVRRESKWPYKRSATRQHKVVVRAR